MNEWDFHITATLDKSSAIHINQEVTITLECGQSFKATLVGAYVESAEEK